MIYALWDTDTHNLVAEYERLEEALHLVLRGIERNGPQDADALALEVENEHGDVRILAQGEELASLARQEHTGNDRLAR